MGERPNEPTEQEIEEMRAAYEAELQRITTADVVLQTAVSLINLAGRRLGRAAGTEQERDLEQVRDAIDAVRGLMPVLERRAAAELGPLRDALSQLQMAYAQEAQAAPAPTGAADAPAAASNPEPKAPETPESDGRSTPPKDDGETDQEGRQRGPAESSGRLWVPGR